MSILELEQPDGTPAVETFAARVVQPPYQVIHGSFLTVDAPVGATTLVVDDGADFDDSGEGGWLRLRLSADADVPDVYLEYVDWDGDETDVEYVTLAAPLAAAVPAGTMVDVWDPIDVLPDSHWECLVVFDEPGATAFPVDVKQDIIDALPPETTLGKGQTVTLERAVGADDIELVHAEGDLSRDGTKTPMTQDAFDRTLGRKGGIFRTAPVGEARGELDADEGGGYLRFVNALNRVIGILRVITEEGRQWLSLSTSGEDPVRIRLRNDVVDGVAERVIDFLAATFTFFGRIVTTGGIVLPRGNQVLRGVDGQQGVERNTGGDGLATVQHFLGAGASFSATPRGSNAGNFNMKIQSSTDTEVRFVCRYEAGNSSGQPANSLATFELVTFDWQGVQVLR